MAFLTFNFSSSQLSGNTSVDIILPDCARGVKPGEFYTPDKKFKVLWLLHGGGGDHSDWTRKTSIERYACERELVVVMPSARGSGYRDIPGYSMWTFMNETLMPMVYTYFPASEKPEDNYVAGLSMGGMGTCRWAFLCPEKFNAMAAMSCGPFSFERIFADETHPLHTTVKTKFKNDQDALHNDDLWLLAEQMLASGKKLPRMYFMAGFSDPLRAYENMLDFKAHTEPMGLEAKYEGWEGGHDWKFWDTAIQKALSFFFDENE